MNNSSIINAKINHVSLRDIVAYNVKSNFFTEFYNVRYSGLQCGLKLKRKIMLSGYLYDLKESSLLSRVRIFFWKFSSWYGKSVTLWTLWALFFWELFARIYQVFEIKFNGIAPEDKIEKYRYLSTVIFTTLGFGDITPADETGRLLVSLEVIVGYIMLGTLIAILNNILTESGE